MRRILAGIFLLAASACSAGTEAPTDETTQAVTIQVDPKRELLILDLSVVEDPTRSAYPGAWSFGHLIEELAGERDVEEFIVSWLTQYATDIQVNGFNVEYREFFLERVLGAWKEKSKKNGVEGLDLSDPPFRLLGIANRIDLRESSAGQVVNAGEGRMIFSFIDPGGDPEASEDILRATMIMEYHLPASSCEQVQKWANAWHSLGSLAMGSDAYKAKLELITRSFTDRTLDGTSHLAQLRTNEQIDVLPWQWREFQLNDQGWLAQTTVANTPDTQVNHSKLFADYVNTNEALILSGQHQVPLTWRGKPFRGGSSDGEPASGHFEAPGIQNNEARHQVSFLTCVGCHTNETGAGFFQVGLRSIGHASFASGFLTGIDQPDPIDPNTIRHFADLKRRQVDLARLLSASCGEIQAHQKLARPH
jgi:hypothetical protein